MAPCSEQLQGRQCLQSQVRTSGGHGWVCRAPDACTGLPQPRQGPHQHPSTLPEFPNSCGGCTTPYIIYEARTDDRWGILFNKY